MRRALFSHVFIMALSTSFFPRSSQNPCFALHMDIGSQSQGHSASEQGPVVPQMQSGAPSLQIMSALSNLPDVSPPAFRDPDAREMEHSFQALMTDYLTSKQRSGAEGLPLNPYKGLANSLQERAKEMTAQYGSQDPRAIVPLENAALVLAFIHDDGAAPLLERAIRLRETTGTESVNYLKDLKVRCNMEVMESAAPHIQSCTKAFQIRSEQVGATSLELATWLRTIGLSSSYLNRQRSLDYLEHSLSYYAKVSGISTAFFAAEYRRLTILAFSLGDNEHAFQLNDLTNQYLSRGDDISRKAMVSNERLKAAAAIPITTYATGAAGHPSWPKITPQQQKEIDDAQQKFQALMQQYNSSNQARPQDQMMNLFTLSEQMRDNASHFGEKDSGSGSRRVHQSGHQLTPENADCSKLDGAAWLADTTVFAQRQNPNIKERLNSLSSVAFFWTSVLQSCPQPAIAKDRTELVQGISPMPGYGTIVHYKGAFTESIAPRKPIILPGSGQTGHTIQKREELTTQYIDVMKARGHVAMLAIMPQEQRQDIKNLPPEAQDKAIEAYFADLQQKDPAKAEEIKKRLRAEMQAQQQQTPAFQAVARNADELKKTMQASPYTATEPLAFLGMLKPKEVFVDIYEYRNLQEGRFGAEQYVAVISQSPTSGKKILLGAAEPIESTINSFYDALNGGDSLEATWKALQQRVVQPIITALPPDTKRVWLSPDSSLLSVPFAALLLDMGIQTEVSIIPSPYDFVRVRSATPPTSGGVLFVGNLIYGKEPLPFPSMGQTEEEMAVLSSAAANAKMQMATLSGNNVKRPIVINLLKQQVRYLHLSTHGFLENPITQPDADIVLPGGVALSGANSGAPDSFLTAEEIRQINLSSVELVTLSACDTAKGRTIEGQGLLGFQTAFMASGARSLLFSLWKAPADTATTGLMEAFYEGIWKNHLSKAEALRQAQSRVRSNPRFADPRNWAGWVLVGEAW